MLDFLSCRYLEVGSYDDAKFWDIKAADYALAFQSLNTIAVNDLREDQRALIANNILRILTTAIEVSVSTMTAHLVMLQKLISKPSGRMYLLSNLEPSVKDNTKPKHSHHFNLLQIARKIDDKFLWSADNVECVETLGMLADSVLK